MIKRISTLLLLSGILFTSCQKSGVSPDNGPTQPVQKSITGTTVFNRNPNNTASYSTPVNGYLRLQLAKDSINTDNILISFNPAAKTKFVPGEDAPAMGGFGLVNLASFSSDNVPLAINVLPLTTQGLTIGLNIYAKTDGIYSLSMIAIQSVPDNYSIYIKDAYKKDSLDMRTYSSYAFNILKADTTSFGKNRFKLVIRSK